MRRVRSFSFKKKNNYECILYYKILRIYCSSSRVRFSEKKEIEDNEIN